MGPIVFYDGTCDFCHRWVQWMIDRDADRIFRFASLQSDFAADLLLYMGMKRIPDTILLLKDGSVFLIKSEAVAYILSQLDPASVFYRMLKVFPRFLSDMGYHLMAAARKKIRPRSCRLFNREEKMLFLNEVDFQGWLSENNLPSRPKKSFSIS